MKRTILILGIIVILCVGWAVGWFYVRDQVSARLDTAIANLERRGKTIECNDRAIEGFPFRIEINCPVFLFEDAQTGFGFNTRSLKTAAQVYQPQKIIAEMQPVGSLQLPQQGLFAIDWKLLRASAAFKLEGIDRFSIAGDELQIVPINNELAEARIEDFQFHGKREEENDIRLALIANGATSKKALWPDTNLFADFVVSDVYQQVSAGLLLDEIGRQNGLSGELKSLDYDLIKGGRIQLSGPFQINKQGSLSGIIDIKVFDANAIISDLVRLNPDVAHDIRNIGTMLAAIAKKNEDGSLEIRLSVKDGQILFGLVPVGFLPPLY